MGGPGVVGAGAWGKGGRVGAGKEGLGGWVGASGKGWWVRAGGGEGGKSGAWVLDGRAGGSVPAGRGQVGALVGIRQGDEDTTDTVWVGVEGMEVTGGPERGREV